jgi:hypothetical protein
MKTIQFHHLGDVHEEQIKRILDQDLGSGWSVRRNGDRGCSPGA